MCQSPNKISAAQDDILCGNKKLPELLSGSKLLNSYGFCV